MTGIPDGPFPVPAPPDEQREWVDAGLNTPGVNTAREALESFAPFVVDLKGMLTAPDRDGRRRFTESALRNVHTEAGEMLVAVVRMHGAGGSVWEYNERISSSWHSLANPAALREEERSLSHVRPYTRVKSDGSEEILAAVESVTASREVLVANLEKAAKELSQREGSRPYDLEQDLILNGQQEPGLYLAQHVRIEEPPLRDAEGNFRHPAEHWHWMAVRGNNRTERRQRIYGVTSAEVLAGMPVKHIGGDGEQIIFDPNIWLTRLSELLNAEYAMHLKTAGAKEMDEVPRAVRASKVAVVESHLVVGCPTPRRLYRIVQMSNRRDHVHPPLEFTPNDRGRALGRSTLGIYVAEGALDEEMAAVLSGSAPISDLPGIPSDAKVSEMRDIRSMQLLRELFPVDRRKRLLIRRALSESPPSQLSAPEVNRRARAWSALTSESYPNPWNPRIAEVFQLADIRDGLDPSRRRLPELLAAAEDDDGAFEELIAFRAAHWLAAFDIIDADRGSLTGQKTDDEGTQAARVRRTVKNNLMAMRNHRRKAVGVLRELASAMDEGDRRPRKVAESGEPLVEPMNRAWFNREFPKESGARTRGSSVARTRGSGSGGPAPTASTGSAPSAGTPAGTGRDGEEGHDTAGQNASATGQDSGPHTSGEPMGLAADDNPSGDTPSAGSPGALGSAPQGDGVSGLPALAEELEQRVRLLVEEVSALRTVTVRLADRAREESVAHPLSRQKADGAGLGMMTAEVELRRLRSVLDGMAEPL
ncbi:hypothetical protein ACWGGS_38350 [Streptomyces decoyicus]